VPLRGLSGLEAGVAEAASAEWIGNARYITNFN
jgi:hypothetical protein